MTQDIKFNNADHGPSIMQPVEESNSLVDTLSDAFIDLNEDAEIVNDMYSTSPKILNYQQYYSNQEPQKQQQQQNQQEQKRPQQQILNNIETAKIVPKNTEYKLERTMPYVSDNNKYIPNNLNNNNIGIDLHHNYSTEYNVNNFNNNNYRHNIEDLKSINIYHEPSFLLIDGKEELRVSTPEIFCKQLGCTIETKLKVVAIFGNTGDGKSHTMNHIFFNGDPIFETSDEQKSCTIGVWAALQASNNILCLDTEGLLGATHNENHRMRMLLKILAISDIIIYRSRSERLHSDMFKFLGTASKAFHKHFSVALQSFGVLGSPQSLGPAVIIFHETRNTKIIESVDDKSTEDVIRERFTEMNIDLEAFSSIKYVGIQTKSLPTDFSKIINAVQVETINTSVRSPRTPNIIYKAIHELNLKFCGKLSPQLNPFPEQYFTCGVYCESCERRCELSMGHITEGKNHVSSERCKYKHLYQNKVFLCKRCYTNSCEVVVTITSQSTNDNSLFGLVKYAWSGSVIECPNCGEIYRSRQHWYGNKTPEDESVRTEIVHVWKDRNIFNNGSTNSAQMILDSVNYVKETVCNITAQPSKLVTDWVTDSMAPSYWKPNIDIVICNKCKKNFETIGLLKHHCRGCGEGFCQSCSNHLLPVPSRGWNYPVRVCDSCKDILTKVPNACPDIIDSSENSYHTGATTAINPDDKDINVRKYGEIAYNTIATVTSLLEYPKEIIKDTARPTYWIPDDKAPQCYVCELNFGTAEELVTVVSSDQLSNGIGGRKRHHCRSCGQAVCNQCSLERYPAPEHGWTTDVRVCDTCVKQKYKK